MLRHFIHGCVLAAFAAMAIAWTWPLGAQLSAHVPGAGIGDNAAFLWNFWWMRHALDTGVSFFQSPYLFAPIGVDITLHTHTALPALVGATVLRQLPPLAALNITTLASFALNGFVTYLLAWRMLGRRGPAILAGALFGMSPYIAARMSGHFNLIAAWPIPLFVLCAREAFTAQPRARVWAAAAGGVIALTAYIDYYYVVYEIVLAMLIAAGAGALGTLRWRVTRRPNEQRSKWLTAELLLIGVDLALIIAIIATGGFTARLASITISLNNTFNAAQLLSVLIIAALWLRLRPTLTSMPTDGAPRPRALSSAFAMLAMFVAGILPLLNHAIRMISNGEYVTQKYLWRNAPAGIDLITVPMAHPALLALAIRRFEIDPVESVAPVGIVTIVFVALAFRRRMAWPPTRSWALIGSVFFVWALGSHVQIAGHNTGLIMPGVLLRYIPIVSNARMPGRAMVVVYLALAMLAAIGAASINWRSRRFGAARAAGAASAAGVVALCLLTGDFSRAAFALTPASCPAIYKILDGGPPGTLAELPMGVGDGFGDITPMVRRVLICQTLHARPITGGAIARLPPSVMNGYRADPLLAAWLRLSGASASDVPSSPLPDDTTIRERLAADGIAFVMLNRKTASAELREFVGRMTSLELVAEDDERALYRVVSR